jgi:TolB-like protein/DNA-binding winged helix-turn-helix (wHTH) protein/Flp pilus assembly protein TadD
VALRESLVWLLPDWSNGILSRYQRFRMRETEVQGYRFGPYGIDSGERLLRRSGELIPLPPKAIDTLLVLVASAGRMVDKGDLMQAVWPDTFVEEGALTRNISLLRKALGDTKEEGGYIETIPKRGYRFAAEVRTDAPEIAAQAPIQPVPAEPVDMPAAARPSALSKWAAPAAVLLLATAVALGTYVSRGRDSAIAAPAARTPASTLAVLPFRNVSDDDAQEYFADGMTEALVTVLAKLGNLRVISLASQAGGRGAAALDAALSDPSISRVLIGSVLRSGERVRINAQLIDPKTRAVYWANDYDRDLKDVFALQSEVAQAIANEIQVTITSEDKQRLQQNRQVNPQALDAYLRGRYSWNRRTEDGMREAVRYFQQAIASDPTYAPAYSGLADSYSVLGSIGIDGAPPNTVMPMAKSAAKEALELDPNLAEAHASLAYVKLSYDWDLPGARQEFARAIALDPSSATAHHWYSHYFMAAGDMANATDQMRAAQRLEPLSSSINIGIGWCYYYSKRYQEAIDQYRAVVEMEPSFPMAHQTLGMAYQQKGMMLDAITEFKTAVELSGENPGSVAGLASAYAAAGQTDLARQELARLNEISKRHYVPAFYIASVYLALGEDAKTFEWGWKALEERTDYLMYLRMEPRAGRLAGNPEFIRVLARLHP